MNIYAEIRREVGAYNGVAVADGGAELTYQGLFRLRGCALSGSGVISGSGWRWKIPPGTSRCRWRSCRWMR